MTTTTTQTHMHRFLLAREGTPTVPTVLLSGHALESTARQHARHQGPGIYDIIEGPCIVCRLEVLPRHGPGAIDMIILFPLPVDEL